MNSGTIIVALIVISASSAGSFMAGKQWAEGIQAEKDAATLEAQAEEDALRLANEEARQIREAALRSRAQELEDLAFNADIVDNCGLPVDGVRRLRLR